MRLLVARNDIDVIKSRDNAYLVVGGATFNVVSHLSYHGCTVGDCPLCPQSVCALIIALLFSQWRKTRLPCSKATATDQTISLHECLIMNV
eukprot:4592444-Pleurochrysis_carterae.AAC.3